MPTITVMDPVTRIEGHMKVEITVDNNKITDARCTGTLFRGFEVLLAGRAPWDAPVITQRICGVCPTPHAQAAVQALDSAANWTPPENARLLRNLVLGADYIQSHILHFYLLAMMDYVKGPQVAPWTPAWEGDMRAGLEGLVTNLTSKALEARRRAHEMGAVFGGKMPIPQSFIPGGITSTPSVERITKFRGHLDWLTGFIKNTYMRDAEALAAVYPEYRQIGKGPGNLLSFGVFREDANGVKNLFTPGYMEEGKGQVWPLAPNESRYITESVTHSWYDQGTNNLNPDQGKTTPLYPKANAYSWLKAPRFNTKPFEVGPLARMWINGDYRNGISVMDRHLARARETLKVAEAMQRWLNDLVLMAPSWNGYKDLSVGEGIGMTEAPRGALGHWVEIAGGKIKNYQIITPTCWNASPRDDQEVPGPMEQALIGTPVKDPTQPIEALRVIHSFDPCLSCAVHVMKPWGTAVVFRTGPV